MSRAEITKRRIAKIKADGYKTEKAYRKTPKGFLVSTWHNMTGRVSGHTKAKDHLYKGLSICEKEQFYDFSWRNSDFTDLYIQWVISGFEKKYTPSIDRIDPKLGYVLGNMRWLTLSENSRTGAVSRWQRQSA